MIIAAFIILLGCLFAVVALKRAPIEDPTEEEKEVIREILKTNDDMS
jgi:hypothetical protein